jgi:hypothetical protein
MHNAEKWNIAITRFAGFCSDIPLSPNEDDVSEYHDIVTLLEEAYGHDLNRFRVAPHCTAPKATNAAPDTIRACWARHPETHVESRYFRSQVRGLVKFLTDVLGRPN